jgi:hypothetical protein
LRPPPILPPPQAAPVAPAVTAPVAGDHCTSRSGDHCTSRSGGHCTGRSPEAIADPHRDEGRHAHGAGTAR